LLIDCDPQSNATSGLGVDKSKLQKDIYDVLLHNSMPQDIIQQLYLPELRVIPSTVNLTGAEIELISLLNREYRLKNALKNIENDYDFIIIDSPPSLGLLTINALTAATSVLIPIQCEYYALEGLSQLLNTVNLVRENLNPDLAIEGVLLTMADYRTNLTFEVINETRQFFKEKVFKAIIPRNIRLSEAPGFGKPIHMYDKDSIGAKMYLSLASEILDEEIQDSNASSYCAEDKEQGGSECQKEFSEGA
ncbi:MAG: AAA family ATPase, partial [Candidatus Omnitrophica bacterium]|nr:AAA family ATPase [Candidatus Omnitrophota bacterium]